jgi:hypothetical protein
MQIGTIPTISGIIVTSIVYRTIKITNDITINIVDSGIKITSLLTGYVITFFFGKISGEIVRLVINKGYTSSTYYIKETSELRSIIISLIAGGFTFLSLSLLDFILRNGINMIKDYKKYNENNNIKKQYIQLEDIYEHEYLISDDFIEIIEPHEPV